MGAGVSRSEETQPGVLFSVEIVMWENDTLPNAEELTEALWTGLSSNYIDPAAIYVKEGPFNIPTGGESDV
jgi:hypothetical protein